jgi:hypothetical protein
VLHGAAMHAIVKLRLQSPGAGVRVYFGGDASKPFACSLPRRAVGMGRRVWHACQGRCAQLTQVQHASHHMASRASVLVLHLLCLVAGAMHASTNTTQRMTAAWGTCCLAAFQCGCLLLQLHDLYTVGGRALGA